MARDLMDALYPYDRSLKLVQLEDTIIVCSKLAASQLHALLQQYPIRGLLRERKVVAHAVGSIEDALIKLFAEAAQLGLRVRAVEIRAGGLIEKKKVERLARTLLERFKMSDARGLRVKLVIYASAHEECYSVLLAV